MDKERVILMGLLKCIRTFSMSRANQAAIAGICCLWLSSTQVSAEDKSSQTRLIQLDNAVIETLEITTLAGQVPGVLGSLDVKEGNVVRVGQELGRVRDTSVKLQVERAKAALEVAKKKQQDDIDERLASKSLAVAENEYQRAVNANRSVRDTYPINEIDRLKLVVDRCKLEVERAVYQRTMNGLEAAVADADYRQAVDLSDRHRIVSPVNGLVVLVEKHVGEWTEPGTPILTVMRTDRVRINGVIRADDFVDNLLGKPAQVRLTRNPEISARGKVVFVNPKVEPLGGETRVYIEIDNPQGKFRPGLNVEVQIAASP